MFSIIAVPRPPRLDSKWLIAVAIAAVLAAFALPAHAGGTNAYVVVTTPMPHYPVHVDSLKADSSVVVGGVIDASELRAGHIDAAEIAADHLTLRPSDGRFTIGVDGVVGFIVDKNGAHDGLGHAFATKNDLTEAVLSGVLGGVMFSVFMTVLGLTLFARAFALRRWIARAHRSLAEHMPPYR